VFDDSRKDLAAPGQNRRSTMPIMRAGLETVSSLCKLGRFAILNNIIRESVFEQ